jgi:hypothetical protein
MGWLKSGWSLSQSPVEWRGVRSDGTAAPLDSRSMPQAMNWLISALSKLAVFNALDVILSCYHH